MVAGAHRPELARREAGQRALGREVRVGDLVDDGVVGVAAVLAAQPERHLRGDGVHERRHGGPDVRVAEIGEDRLVTAPDVVADGRRADVVAVGDHAADRRAVAEVVVGHECAAGAGLGVEAALHLRQRALVRHAEHGEGGTQGKSAAIVAPSCWASSAAGSGP